MARTVEPVLKYNLDMQSSLKEFHGAEERVAAAVAAERERCARIAEQHDWFRLPKLVTELRCKCMAGAAIAAKIRQP